MCANTVRDHAQTIYAHIKETTVTVNSKATLTRYQAQAPRISWTGTRKTCIYISLPPCKSKLSLKSNANAHKQTCVHTMSQTSTMQENKTKNCSSCSFVVFVDFSLPRVCLIDATKAAHPHSGQSLGNWNGFAARRYTLRIHLDLELGKHLLWMWILCWAAWHFEAGMRVDVKKWNSEVATMVWTQEKQTAASATINTNIRYCMREVNATTKHSIWKNKGTHLKIEVAQKALSKITSVGFIHNLVSRSLYLQAALLCWLFTTCSYKGSRAFYFRVGAIERDLRLHNSAGTQIWCA